MAHWKKIAQHPFKLRVVDSLIEKDSVATTYRNDEPPRLTESYKPSPISSQNNIIPTVPTQSPSQQEDYVSDENFENSQIEKEAEAVKICEIKRFTDIRHPHDHDVLMGRGNFVNYHPGNLYFRNLIKKHFVQYVSSCKNEKPKYANLIIDEVGMRSPPGRFLRQDFDTKMWNCVDHKKALDKTRQALREGAPEAKIRGKNILDQDGFENSTCCSGDKMGLPPNAQDHFSRANSQSALMIPYHVGSLDDSTLETTPVVNPAPLTRPQTLLKQTSFRINNDRLALIHSADTLNTAANMRPSGNNVPMNSNNGNGVSSNKILASEKLANSVAARLMKSHGIRNENIENLVALGILAALNGGIDENNSTQNSVSSTQADSRYRAPDELPETNTNTTKTHPFAATDESLVSAVASGVAKISELSTLAKPSKRQMFSRQMSDITFMSKKRWKGAASHAPPSVAKDSCGAEALLAFSHGNEENRKASSSDESSVESEKNDAVPVPPDVPLPISKQNGSGIWSTPSLGNFMQCDTCLGAGILPLPSPTMTNLHGTSRDLISNPASIARSSIGANEMPPPNISSVSSINQVRNVTVSNALPTTQQKSKGNISKESDKSSSIWTDKIRKVEMKWGIALDETKSFSQRVEAIEKKALNCRNVLHSSSKYLVSEGKKGEGISIMNTDRTLKEVEIAEEKWGLSPPEGYNLTERIEMIEQTAYSFVKRLELCR